MSDSGPLRICSRSSVRWRSFCFSLCRVTGCSALTDGQRRQFSQRSSARTAVASRTENRIDDGLSLSALGFSRAPVFLDFPQPIRTASNCSFQWPPRIISWCSRSFRVEYRVPSSTGGADAHPEPENRGNLPKKPDGQRSANSVSSSASREPRLPRRAATFGCARPFGARLNRSESHSCGSAGQLHESRLL